MSIKKLLITLGATLSLTGISGVAQGAVVNWTDWTSGTTGLAGNAAGNIMLGGSSIDVRYTGEINFIQTAGGTDWWLERSPAPYTGNAVIDNAPPASDIIAVVQGGITNTLTFSTPLVDPIMAFVSIGRPSLAVDYAFDSPFTLLSEGFGWWGDGSWTQTGNTLTGNEAHGAIQFNGSLSSISWVNDPSENWHGFTIGVVDPAVIPVPAAVWLFGTALIGFLGYSRRRKVG